MLEIVTVIKKNELMPSCSNSPLTSRLGNSVPESAVMTPGASAEVALLVVGGDLAVKLATLKNMF